MRLGTLNMIRGGPPAHCVRDVPPGTPHLAVGQSPPLGLILALILTTGLSAQVPQLPWEDALLPPWISQSEGATQEPSPPPAASAGKELSLDLRPDGRLRIADRKGTLRLSMGLPGRPRRVWRDGGQPLEPMGRWDFPDKTPFSERGIAQLLTAPDPRSALWGLFWVLDDGERRLTVVHPATAKVLFLRLPEGESPDLAFFPDHLEFRARTEGGPRRWSLPWAALLPHLARLGPTPKLQPRGTALQPYPSED